MRKNEGITLIALVITIIVLLILAGVSIATLLGQNGILNQAEKAKVENRGATVEEECNLWKTNKKMDSQTAQVTAQTLKELLDSLEERNLLTAEERATIEETGEITIGSRTIEFGKETPPVEQAKVGVKVTDGNKPYIDADGDKAIIPEGFTIVPGCEDISEGLVISDNDQDTEAEPIDKVTDGNQFVWVPVENFNEFERTAGYEDGALQSCEFVSNARERGKYYEPKGDGITVSEEATGTEKEAQEMYKSVKDNGGFYIGRYEAGTTETSGTGIRGTMVCKKEATVYNCIGWASTNDIETGGAVQVAREFAQNQGYTSVTSTLCYGVQWDAVMRWMNKIDNQNVPGKKYIEDSTGMGWHEDNSNRQVKNTGTDIESGENKVKNIYDMAGNVEEWTMEAESSGSTRVFRGGYYSGSAVNYPVSVRSGDSPTEGNTSIDGFRPTLYICTAEF